MSGFPAGRQVQRYRAKLSGPLLDRIDIHIDGPAVPYKELSGGVSGEGSAVIRERVNAARQRQLARFGGTRGAFCNAQMESADLRRFCELDIRGHDLLKLAMTRLGLSARAYDRVLKVARTIADLESVDGVRAEHVSEAIQYRSLDRSPWGVRGARRGQYRRAVTISVHELVNTTQRVDDGHLSAQRPTTLVPHLASLPGRPSFPNLSARSLPPSPQA